MRHLVLIGLGSLGAHLADRIRQTGFPLKQVITSNETLGRQWSSLPEVTWGRSPEEVSDQADLIILAVPDQVIDEVLRRIPEGSYLLVHTSGSVPMSALERKGQGQGVLYPLQSFSKERQPEWSSIPVYYEAASEPYLSTMHELATRIGGFGQYLTSDNRMRLHVSAVFSSNFTNLMIDLAQELVEEAGLKQEAIRPLLEETVQKALSIGGYAAQTGPAKRGDLDTVKKHLDLLSYHQLKTDIYRLLSAAIGQRHRTE